MHLSKILAFSLFFLAACSNQNAAAQAKLDTDAAEKLIAATPDLQLVDVRTPAEVKAGRIPGATNIDFRDPNFQANIGKLDRAKPILVYCAVGGRSGSAAAMLTEMGFQKVYDLGGGFRDWKAKNKPVDVPK